MPPGKEYSNRTRLSQPVIEFSRGAARSETSAVKPVRNAADRTTLSKAVTQKLLAEMIGITRERVNFMMNKFRRLGLVDYNGVLGEEAEDSNYAYAK